MLYSHAKEYADKLLGSNPAASLRAIINARDNEVNEMMATLNQIQQGFAEINAAENRVTLAKEGEKGDKYSSR